MSMDDSEDNINIAFVPLILNVDIRINNKQSLFKGIISLLREQLP